LEPYAEATRPVDTKAACNDEKERNDTRGRHIPLSVANVVEGYGIVT